MRLFNEKTDTVAGKNKEKKCLTHQTREKVPYLLLINRLANLVIIFLYLKQFPGARRIPAHHWQEIHRLAVLLEKHTRP